MENLSKRMSYALRHNPEQYALDMAEDGSVELLHFCQSLNMSQATVEHIVCYDNKQRFTIDGGRVWANQGHSIAVNTLLTPVLAGQDTTPSVLYHGTKAAFVDSIRHLGLVRKTRQYVHLSGDYDTAITVGARRKGQTVILLVDVAELLAAGHTLWKSANGVYLTESVPPEFLSVDG